MLYLLPIVALLLRLPAIAFAGNLDPLRQSDLENIRPIDGIGQVLDPMTVGASGASLYVLSNTATEREVRMGLRALGTTAMVEEQYAATILRALRSSRGRPVVIAVTAGGLAVGALGGSGLGGWVQWKWTAGTVALLAAGLFLLLRWAGVLR